MSRHLWDRIPAKSMISVMWMSGFLIFGTFAAQAQTNESINSGNWSDGANWSQGSKPDTLDEVLITGDLITLSENSVANSVTIDQALAELTASSSFNLTGNGAGSNVLIGSSGKSSGNILWQNFNAFTNNGTVAANLGQLQTFSVTNFVHNGSFSGSGTFQFVNTTLSGTGAYSGDFINAGLSGVTLSPTGTTWDNYTFKLSGPTNISGNHSSSNGSVFTIGPFDPWITFTDNGTWDGNSTSNMFTSTNSINFNVAAGKIAEFQGWDILSGGGHDLHWEGAGIWRYDNSTTGGTFSYSETAVELTNASCLHAIIGASDIFDSTVSMDSTSDIEVSGGSLTLDLVSVLGGKIIVFSGATITTQDTDFNGTNLLFEDGANWSVGAGTSLKSSSKLSIGNFAEEKYSLTLSADYSVLSDTFGTNELTPAAATTLFTGLDILDTSGWELTHLNPQAGISYTLEYYADITEAAYIQSQLGLGLQLGFYKHDGSLSPFIPASFTLNGDNTGTVTALGLTLGLSSFVVGFESNAIPEPATLWLLLMPLGWLARKFRKGP